MPLKEKIKMRNTVCPATQDPQGSPELVRRQKEKGKGPTLSPEWCFCRKVKAIPGR